jgi:hypothetical protein
MTSRIITVVNNNSAHGTAVFNDPIKIDPAYDYSLALHSANLWYSYYNISATLANNVFTYNNGVADKTITIPSGNYGISDINAFIHSVMKENGDYTVVSDADVFDINLIPNYNTLKLQIVITNGYSINFTGTNFGKLIGFDPQNVTATKYGERVADISNGIDSLAINCDAIDGSYSNGVAGQVLYTFVPSTAPGSNISVQPRSLIFCPVYKNIIRSISITITDQNQNRLDFNGEGSSYLLELRITKK